MTLHAAKGLEFPVVFITGLEEGIFPHAKSSLEPAALEEERRLAYVGLTRAKEKLYLLWAFRRLLFGETQANMPSRFLKELPEEEVIRIRDSLYELGHLIFDDWLDKNTGSKYPVRVLQELKESNKIEAWKLKDQKQA